MAKFEVGNKFGKGRPPGKLNRSTEQAKLAVARIANHGLDVLREDIERIRQDNPVEAARLYLKLLEYIVPKKSAVEISGELKQQIQQITVNINHTGSESTNRDNDNVS